MSDSKNTNRLTEYHGSCHCGDFKFRVELAPIQTVFACNCSICSRNSYLWAALAADEHLVIETGVDGLKGYEFGNRARTHKFCPKCGTSVLAKAKSPTEGRSAAINVRTIHDLNLEKLEIKLFEGWALNPDYTPSKVLDTLSAGEGERIYNGSCHCSAVTYSVRSELLVASGPKVASCDCSICSRNGYLWIYPRHKNIAIHGEDALTNYIFGERSIHRFCSTCGVSLFNKMQDPTIDMVPVNIRTLNDINVQELNIEKDYLPQPVYFNS